MGGKRAGITGKRSGLWGEYARLIQEVQPSYVLIENVFGLLVRGGGFGRVLSDLAALGFDAEWRVFAAGDFGAPHLRERVFVIAYRPTEHEKSALEARIFADADGACFDGAERVYAPRGNVGNDAQLGGVLNWNGLQVDRTSRAALAQGVCDGLRCEPVLNRLDDGISALVGAYTKAVKAHGNAVVPQVAEHVGRCLLRFHARRVRCATSRAGNSS